MSPWEKVLKAFGMNQAQMAKELRFHRSKISRDIHSKAGRIDSYTQVLIVRLAKERGINLDKADLVADV